MKQVKQMMKMPNKVLNNIEYAGFGKRLKAFTFDYLIILAYIVLMAGMNFGIILKGRALEDISPLFASPIAKDALAFFTLILPVILYFTLQEGSPRRGTRGKRKAGICVVNANGGTLNKLQAFVRSLVKFLPWQIAHTSIYQIKEVVPGGPSEPFDIARFVLVYVLVGIYIASALISKKHRTPYDWAAGSYVIVEE